MSRCVYPQPLTFFIQFLKTKLYFEDDYGIVRQQLFQFSKKLCF